MEAHYKKTFTLFKIWCLINYPELELPTFVEEFEDEYDEFKAFVDEFAKIIVEKL